MKYKCIKEYRKQLDDNTTLVFTEGVDYSKEQVIGRIPMPMVPEYFMMINKDEDINNNKVENEDKINTPISFNTLLDQIKDTHERKNHDYGDSFTKSMDEFGMTAAVIRLTDKLSRFKSLINSEAKVKDESIEDTLLDMASYAIMTVEYLKKKKL
jgi:hypothetical protein